jgi:hypothetical protein
MSGKKKNSVRANNGGISIGGNVTGSNIVQGNNNRVSVRNVNIAPLFEDIYHFVETHPKLQAGKKQDAIGELQEIQTALEESNPDENFITRRFRNLKRMAPDIVEVAMETLKNPIGGVAEIIKKVAKKIGDDAK